MPAMAAVEQPVVAAGDVTSGLRARAARGTLVNAAFMAATSVVGVVQGVIVARILPPDVFGRWGLLMAAFMTLLTLGSVGIDDKYIQQDEADQRRAFEIAFTLQLILVPIFVALLAVGIPAFALLYGHGEIVGPGLALAAAVPALALQMPLWVHYRRMDFVRQRVLGAIDPVVTCVVTVALALAGLRLWALVLGALAGTFAASAAIAATSPYALRVRYDRAAMREYRSFSWPLLLSTATTVLLVQGPVVVGSRLLDVTAVGGIALAATISQFATRIETLLTQSMYPAVCRAKDRPDVLWEAFWKSNRLALLWAAPLGVGVALFAGDFVHYVIGEKWRFAVPLIAAYGLMAVVDQIAFNWSAFYRAIGRTRPIAVQSGVQVAVVTVIALPLLAAWGLTAFGAGMVGATAVTVAVRLGYVRRLFPGEPVLRRLVRGLAPSVPAAAVLLAWRALLPGHGLGRTIAEVLLYVGVVAAASGLAERRLLRESLAYLRGRAAAA